MSSHPYFKMSEEMAQKATKRPWHWGWANRIENETTIIEGGGVEPEMADRRYIVHCVNSHAAILGMLGIAINQRCKCEIMSRKDCSRCKEITARLDGLMK